jgi:hypothetical protein
MPTPCSRASGGLDHQGVLGWLPKDSRVRPDLRHRLDVLGVHTGPGVPRDRPRKNGLLPIKNELGADRRLISGAIASDGPNRPPSVSQSAGDSEVTSASDRDGSQTGDLALSSVIQSTWLCRARDLARKSMKIVPRAMLTVCLDPTYAALLLCRCHRNGSSCHMTLGNPFSNATRPMIAL